jgi:hypothetical protein
MLRFLPPPRDTRGHNDLDGPAMCQDIDTATAPPLSAADIRIGRLHRLKKRSGVFGQPASSSDIRALRGMLRERIDGDLASAETALAVQDANPLSIWSLYSQDGLQGGIAFLPLNTLGVYRLIYGKLDPVTPGLECIAVGTEAPAVLYVWALVSRGRGLAALSDVLRHLETPRFRNVDIWTHPVTERGRRLADRLGLARFGEADRAYYKFSRSAP